jgi:hypothetical protein
VGTQTDVTTAPDIGVPGQMADFQTFGDGVNFSKSSEEASAGIPFGVMVAVGTADDGALLIAANTDALSGVAMFAEEFHRTSELDTDGLQPGATFGVLWEGAILVRVENAVTPASTVHVRATANGPLTQKGAFRGGKDGAHTIDCSGFARYLTSADTGGIAVVYIDMADAHLAAADS